MTFWSYASRSGSSSSVNCKGVEQLDASIGVEQEEFANIGREHVDETCDMDGATGDRGDEGGVIFK